MSRMLSNQLIEQFNRHFVGMNNLARFFDEEIQFKSPTYPPTNIEQVDDNTHIITMAVAGYSEDDITITFENRTITISGKKSTDTSSNFIYRGIANREFTRSFILDAYIEIDAIELQNGMLAIKLVREVPEAMKQKSIPIGFSRNTKEIDAETIVIDSSETTPKQKKK